MRISIVLVWIVSMFFAYDAFSQGPFEPAADSVGTNAVHADSNIIYGWVNNCTITRGLQDIANSGGPLATVGNETMVYGKANLSVVSLGDGGSAIIALANPISDHDGFDFAVFENGFHDAGNGGYFLELAYVEVSSNGQDYYPFPNQSLTPTENQIGTFETIDPTNINGLAGKYKGLYGTPFDLSGMDTIIGLDIQYISHIKIKDVGGSINSNYASYDSYGRIINDPYPTAFSSGGFDLDAIALIDSSLVTSIKNLVATQFRVYPNPANDYLFISGELNSQIISISGMQGNVVMQGRLNQNQMDISSLPTGIYFVTIQTKSGVEVHKFVKA